MESNSSKNIKRGKLEGEKRVSFPVKDELHHQLKLICIYNKTSIKEVVHGMLEKYVIQENQKIEEKFRSTSYS